MQYWRCVTWSELISSFAGLRPFSRLHHRFLGTYSMLSLKLVKTMAIWWIVPLDLLRYLIWTVTGAGDASRTFNCSKTESIKPWRTRNSRELLLIIKAVSIVVSEYWKPQPRLPWWILHCHAPMLESSTQFESTYWRFNRFLGEAILTIRLIVIFEVLF